MCALCAAIISVPAFAQEKPPEPGPLRRFDFPKVQELTLSNGMRVLVAERHTLPIVSLRLIIDAGSLREPEDKTGVASLTGSLLREGTGALTGEQIAERMGRLGAQYSTSGTYSFASMDLTTLSTAFGEALALAAPTVTAPSVPQREFDRVRAQAIAQYEQSHASVEGIAQDVFLQAVFQPSAPMARRPGGTKASLSGLTRDDVVSWHRSMYAPAAATALLVGDITVPEARRLMERAFGAWKTPAPRLTTPVNAARPSSGTRVILVDRPGSVQSALRIGHTSLTATDPEYLPMVALNRVLGGGFNARVNMNLREKHGYTYGAFSNMDLRKAGSVYLISSSVRTDATDSALVEAIGEYKRIASEVVPGDELSGATNNVVASFPSSVQSVQELQARIQQLIIWDLPLDYWASYRERLAAVTPSDLQRAGRAHLVPDALTIVVVGDLSKIEQPVRARSLGAVEVWDADGHKVR